MQRAAAQLIASIAKSNGSSCREDRLQTLDRGRPAASSKQNAAVV